MAAGMAAGWTGRFHGTSERCVSTVNDGTIRLFEWVLVGNDVEPSMLKDKLATFRLEVSTEVHR